MKKLILFVSFIFIASLCYGQNMITNGDLETWTDPSTPASWDLAQNVSQESVTVHGGTYSAKHESATGTKYFGHEYTTGITAGNDFTLSYYYLDNDDHARTRLWAKWKDAGGATVGATIESAYSTDDPSWIQYSNTITAPDGVTQFYLEVRVYNQDGSYGGYVYYDDFTFTDEGGATPTIDKAYAISSDELEVFYNMDLTTVTAGNFELTGTATITFSTATIDGTNAKLVHLSGASTPMADDYTLDTISDGAKSTYDFYAGITSIAYTNTLNPGGMIDETHFATFTGIISANDAYNNVWISDAAGAYNGVLIFDYTFYTLVDVGDEILLKAKRATYNNLTELVNPELINTISTGNSPYGPTDIDGSDINETIGVDTNPAESWEGQFVKIENFYVDSYSTADYEYRCMWSDAKTDYYFIVGDNVDYHLSNISLTVGATYSWIIGVVDWNSPNYRINPRSNSDICTIPPENVTIQINGNDVVLTWAPGSAKTTFNVYRCSDPYGTFVKINTSPVTETTYTDVGAATTETKYFYYITEE